MEYSNIELNGIDKDRKEHKYKLSDFTGNNLIVYFYPQDDTPVCTQEAYDFRDFVNKIQTEALIIGVSSNSIEDHIEFHTKHNLNFILLSDNENKLKKAFENITNSIIKRSTFILNKSGEIVKKIIKVDVESQIEELKEHLKK